MYCSIYMCIALYNYNYDIISSKTRLTDTLQSSNSRRPLFSVPQLLCYFLIGLTLKFIIHNLIFPIKLTIN